MRVLEESYSSLLVCQRFFNPTISFLYRYREHIVPLELTFLQAISFSGDPNRCGFDGFTT